MEGLVACGVAHLQGAAVADRHEPLGGRGRLQETNTSTQRREVAVCKDKRGRKFTQIVK